MWTIFKLFMEFLTILLLFYVLVFWPRGIEILAPWPGIEPAPPALEGGVLTAGTIRGVPDVTLLIRLHYMSNRTHCQPMVTLSHRTTCCTPFSHVCCPAEASSLAVNCRWKAHGRNSRQFWGLEDGLSQQPAASKKLKPLGNEFCQQSEWTSKWLFPSWAYRQERSPPTTFITT